MKIVQTLSSSDARETLSRTDEVQAFVDADLRAAHIERTLAGLSLGEERMPATVIAVKDLIHVSGFPTRAGLPAPIEFTGEEASVISTLRSKGAIVAGKTAMDQLAYDSPPSTVNPLDELRTPGGSSFGSAAAVAADLAEIGIGTQTSASIIGPAAFCGLYGFKPSTERSKNDGLVPVSRTLDVVGFLSKDPRLLARKAPAVLHDWRSSEKDSIRVLGVPDGTFFEGMPDYGWRTAFDQQLRVLQDHGYSIRSVPMPWNCLQYRDAYDEAVSLIYAEMAEQHSSLLRKTPELLDTSLTQALERGISLGSPRELRLQRGRRMQDVSARLIPSEIDAIITPSQLGPAPFLDTGRTSWGETTLLWSYLGMPALSIPAGTVDSMPVGLQLVSRWGEDERLLGALEGNLPTIDFSSVYSQSQIQVPRVSYRSITPIQEADSISVSGVSERGAL